MAARAAQQVAPARSASPAQPQRTMQLAPPRKTFQVESLLSGPIDVLTLLHYLHAKQATPLRDLLIGMLDDLSLEEVDQILPQLVHLWVCWEAQQARLLTEFFLAQCARSLHLTLKIMWILHAEEAHAPPMSRALPRISQMLKQAEMAHVNAEIPTKGGAAGQARKAQEGSAAARLAGALKRSATQQLGHGPGGGQRRTPPLSMRSSTSSSLVPSRGNARGPLPPSSFPSSPVNRAARLVVVQIGPAPLAASPASPHSQPEQLVSVRILLAERVAPPNGPRPPSLSPTLTARPRAATTINPGIDGPAQAFTSLNAWWRPSPPQQQLLQQQYKQQQQQQQQYPQHGSRAASNLRSPAAAPRTYSPSPAQLRHEHNSAVLHEQYFASPRAPSVSPNPLSPSPLPTNDSVASPPTGLAQPAMGRALSEEEVLQQSAFLSPRSAASSAARSSGSETSPPAVLTSAAAAADGGQPSPELDVDWPAADQDMASPPTRSSPPSHKLALSPPSDVANSGAAVPSRGPLTPRRYATMGASPPLKALSPPSSGLSQARSDGSADDVAEPILFHLLSKQVRSEYFNLQLLLLATLHDLSKALVAVLPAERNPVLREQLVAIDASIMRGLYLPLIPACVAGPSRHYRILRLLPEDCWSLASRDKAPFLLHVEVAYAAASTGDKAMTYYDADLYTAYKNNAEIMRDAMAVAAVSAARDAANAGQVTPPTDALGEAGDAARSTAAHIAHLKDAGATASPSQVGQQVASGPAVFTEAALAEASGGEEHAVPRVRSSSASTSAAPASSEDGGSAASTASSSPASSSSTLSGKVGALTSNSLTVPSTKSARLVPQANPFRPRRCAAYPVSAGPSLCDQEFAFLSAAFGESLLAKKARVRASSPFASSVPPEQWDVLSVIFKGGDDLRQEVLALQLIAAFDRIWKKARLPLFLQPYSVVITSEDSGLIETIPDAVSVDSLKKRLSPHWTCLADFYAAYFGGQELASLLAGPAEFARRHPSAGGLVTYQTALRNFVESLAGASVMMYILAVKDRHNGNIMIDRAGHIIHIDFGFMLSNSPASNWGFEMSPFKLTKEFLDVMGYTIGGPDSDLFAYYRMLVTRGFLEARAHADEFIVLCAVHARTSHMPCFCGPAALTGPNGVIDAMRARFALHLTSEAEVEKFVDQLINDSIDNWRSRKYDTLQRLTNGIQ